MANNPQVEQIIEYIKAKIDNLKAKLRAYESPMMQDMAKTSPHLQMDYIRLSAELQANEDNLLAIQKFNPPPTIAPKKEKSNGKGDQPKHK